MSVPDAPIVSIPDPLVAVQARFSSGCSALSPRFERHERKRGL